MSASSPANSVERVSPEAEPAERRYPDEDLPTGSVVDGLALEADVKEAFDFVVVGSGASGAVAAHTLARAGHSVAIVEEGPWIKTRDFGSDVLGAFGRLMRDGGLQAMKGRAFMPMLQGRCVGGSTVINSAIAWRTPEDVVEDWRARFGLGDSLTMAELDAHFDALELDLNVRAVDTAVLGGNNMRFLEQAKRDGAAGSAMRRYDRGCKGSSRCLTGCPSAAKQGMSVSYVPWALALGARIFTSCRVQRVRIEHGRAVGILARAGGRRVELAARRGVFVAASTIQTPNLLRRSGLRSRSLGEHFQAHPGLGVAGLFDDTVAMHRGATQGAESLHYRKTEGFKLETLAMQPELVVPRMPGIGRELLERLAAISRLGVWVAQVRAEAQGTVRPTWGGRDVARLTMTERDVARGRKACAVLAQMFFDAGAREVWPGIYGVPAVLRSPNEIRLIEGATLDSRAYTFVASHLFGAARMGPDPRTSVVGLDFCTHEAKGLYVVDSSVFPTNLGVNPQHSIMALSRLAATRVADASRGGKSAAAPPVAPKGPRPDDRIAAA
jgi:choline dehydrogenase-like flavoprotein